MTEEEFLKKLLKLQKTSAELCLKLGRAGMHKQVSVELAYFNREVKHSVQMRMFELRDKKLKGQGKND